MSEAVRDYAIMFQRARGARMQMEMRWRSATQAYMGRNPPSISGIYKFDVFVPWTYALVESIVARAIQEIFSTYPFVAVRGRYGPADDELAKILEDILLWIFENDDFNFMGATDSVLREAVLYGTGFYGITSVMALGPHSAFFMPRLVWVPIVEMYVSPTAVSLDDADYLIRRVLLTRDDFEAQAKAKGWKVPEEAGDANVYYSLVSEVNRILGVDLQPNPMTEGMREVWEVWEPGRVTFVLNWFWEVSQHKLPLGRLQWPYVAVKWSGLPTSFWGIGVAQAIRGLQRSLNILRMQRLHNIDFVLNKLFVALRGGLAPTTEIVAKPGHIIWEYRPNSIRELPVSDVTNNALYEEQNIVRDIQNATGEFDYVRGAPPRTSRERAMTVMRLQEAALTRFSAFMRILSGTTLRALCKKVILQVRQNMPPMDLERIVKRDVQAFYSLEPQEILGQYDFVPYVGKDTQLRETRLQTLVQALPVLMQMPNISKEWLARNFLRLLGLEGWRDAVVSDAELMARIQAMQAGSVGSEGGEQGGEAVS